MGVLVDRDKCTGCGQCEDLCPGDLWYVDEEKKAVIRDQGDCWDCMVCVKACPVQALTTKLPYSLANYKATLVPEVGQDTIKWVSTDIKGQKEVFEIKTREA